MYLWGFFMCKEYLACVCIVCIVSRSWACPQENFEIRNIDIEFGSNFDCNVTLVLQATHMYYDLGNCNSRKTGLTGVETEHRNRNLQNCYLLDSSLVRFTELYKPNYWYAIIVKFFLKFFLLCNALSNKHPCNRVYIDWCHLWSTIIIQFLSSLLILTFTVQVCYNCYNICLNDIQFQYRNNRHLWLKCAINSASIALTKTCKICCNSSQLSSFFTTEAYRIACVTIWYNIVDTQKCPRCKQYLQSTKINILSLFSFTQLDKMLSFPSPS